MTFLSPTFMFIFLPAMLGVFAIIPKHKKTDFLPVAGTVFFVCVNVNDPFALLYIVFVSAAVMGSVAIYKKTRKRRYLGICSAICFAIAAVILAARTSVPAFTLHNAGIIMCLMAAISLCADISRGDGRIPRSLWDSVTYVTYFPVMLAGPFVSYGDFVARCDRLDFGIKNFSKGAMIFIKGFVKTIVVGAVLGDAFGSVIAIDGESMGIVAAIFMGAVQSLALYAFFSGYSDMARGVSYMMGIELDSDMGDPFANPTPAAYLRKFFKGFSIFFKKYIVSPTISRLGDNIFSRIISAVLSAAFLLSLFCQNPEAFIILLPFVSVAEFFVLFGRGGQKRRSFFGNVLGGIVTFFVMILAWAVIASDGVADMLDFCRNAISNGAFYLSYEAMSELTNLKYYVLPLMGCVLSVTTTYIVEHDDESKAERTGFLVLKIIVALLLLVFFALGIILLLPQFPGLSSDVFGANFI